LKKSTKSGWTVSQAAYLRTLQHLRQHAGIKNRPAKKQGVVGAGQRDRTSISFQEEKYSSS